MALKPVESEGLNKVWNDNSSNNTQPSGSKIQTGWEFNEKPAVEYMNWLQRYITAMLKHINAHGLPVWDAETVYPQYAMTKLSTNGQVYTSLVNNNQNNPPATSPGAWTVYNPITSLSSDNVNNDSSVSGATVTDALNTLAAQTFNSDDIANTSTVSGATVTLALETLLGGINAINVVLDDLNTNDVDNSSTRPGTTLTDVLNTTQYRYNTAQVDVTFASFVALFSTPVTIDTGVYEYEFLGVFDLTSGGVDYGMRYSANGVDNKINFIYESNEAPAGPTNDAFLTSAHVYNNVPTDIDFLSLTDPEINTGLHPYRFKGVIQVSGTCSLTVEARQTTANGLSMEINAFFRVTKIA